MWVIKLGGGEGNALEPALLELARRWHDGQRWVLVHGGSARTNEVATALGHPPRFVTSPAGYTSRRTDAETAQIFTMVVAGDLNKQIVRRLQALGVDALGLSGLDGRLLEARRKRALRVVENGRQRILRDDYTGTVKRVNADLLRSLLDQGYAPVICPPALGEDHEALNVDGDRAAAAIASALGAQRLLLLTGAPGLLRDAEMPESVIPSLDRTHLEQATRDYAQGRMRLKLRAAGEALEGGVGAVHIAASDRPDPLSRSLAGEGTVIR